MIDKDKSNKVGDIFAALYESNQIWDEPQFLVADVCAITGATPKAIEHFVNPSRGLVRLHGNWVNPGTGKRRMFTGGQVLMIAAAYAMNKIGFPQKFSATMAETIERRAKSRWTGLGIEKNFTIITYPANDQDDWIIKTVHEQTTEEPVVPVAAQVLSADRLIDETFAQLSAVIAGEDMPDFKVSDPKPEPSPFSPASNFFRSWEKDAGGRWIYVGLDHEETQELMEMQGSVLEGDELKIVRVGRDDYDGERYLELHDRHEAERLKRVGAEHAAKIAEEGE